ncbi:tyrosine-protein phosphatase non-receptor type 18 isoform X8 [Heterocephalus glaber]|uniref:protein-tyrosine-phosphatase n=1 Tax=Heterocephalus glaber TaxID=10181 RepID=A0AAX6TMI7_HETGA|nr:tyrosine-protein phosphatase non-receptor type 18 isoform X8 [Heterocephalus glaber]
MSCSLDAVRSFLERLEARGGREGAALAREFSDIRARSAAWKTDEKCSTEAGNLPRNVRKNRYKDVVPYDHTRSILSLLQEEGHGDYINGSFIRGADGSQAYIATQGPLPHTLLDFWRLVWEFGVKVILMACRETENDRKKCERYWPQEHEPLQIGPFCITLTKETPLNADIILRTLKVTFQKESRSAHHLQYMSWPDRGVPGNPDTVLTMIEEARRLQGSSSRPLCVHCSAGCGRTGVLCTIDYVRQLLLTQNCAPLYDDALSLWTSPALLAIPCPPGRVLRSISMPATQTLAMADTYAVVQKSRDPAGAAPGSWERSTVEKPLYSQVTARAQLPRAHAEDAQGAPPALGLADQSPAGPDAYEDVTDGAQTGGLGFNLRIGRPKGPRDPPAEWTRPLPFPTMGTSLQEALNRSQSEDLTRT